ncbi:MAG: hypothetical protein HFF02_02880 [Erysipelotrichaceae bacterium]|nr:hypothetical protein [Erysipelotrichaceae bacterium]
MRKRMVLGLVVVLLSACTQKVESDKDFQYTYNSFVESILDNNGVQSKDIPFTHTLDVSEDKNGEYRYKITIDEPRIAMYNIQMMVVDKTANGQYPFIGLMNDDMYSMIPNQENKEKNFVKGIVLEGVSKTPKFTLYVQVNWKDYAQVNTKTVFFTYTYEYQKDQVSGQSNEK